MKSSMNRLAHRATVAAALLALAMPQVSLAGGWGRSSGGLSSRSASSRSNSRGSSMSRYVPSSSRSSRSSSSGYASRYRGSSSSGSSSSRADALRRVASQAASRIDQSRRGSSSSSAARRPAPTRTDLKSAVGKAVKAAKARADLSDRIVHKPLPHKPPHCPPGHKPPPHCPPKKPCKPKVRVIIGHLIVASKSVHCPPAYGEPAYVEEVPPAEAPAEAEFDVEDVPIEDAKQEFEYLALDAPPTVAIPAMPETDIVIQHVNHMESGLSTRVDSLGSHNVSLADAKKKPTGQADGYDSVALK